MIKQIELNFGVKIEVADTDYAKSHILINDLARMDQVLAMKLK